MHLALKSLMAGHHMSASRQARLHLLAVLLGVLRALLTGLLHGPTFLRLPLFLLLFGMACFWLLLHCIRIVETLLINLWTCFVFLVSRPHWLPIAFCAFR
jgi:hypothetical protein